MSAHQQSRANVTALMESMRRKGIKLWAENGQLHYKAVKGALTREELQTLHASKGEIVALFTRDATAVNRNPRSNSHGHIAHAPVAFSQLAHWHLYRLKERASIRQVAWAVRVRGPLDVKALHRSLTEVCRRHDALRTRIVLVNDVPIQEIVSNVATCLELEDLTPAAGDMQQTLTAAIGRFLSVPIQLDTDSLLGVRLLRVDEHEHVLLAAMEHMISDAASMNLFLQELFTAYAQLSHGEPLSLPPIGMQFPDYAIWQRSSHPAWLSRHRAYWSERLDNYQRVRFRGDKGDGAPPQLGWGIASLKIDQRLKSEIAEWSRIRKTTSVMCVFTAFVGFLLRWCDSRDIIVQFQSDGRTNPQIQNTIGYFAAVLYLRVQLGENAGFGELLEQVTAEYCRAQEHADSSYMESCLPRPDFARSGCFNWVPKGSSIGFNGLGGTSGELECAPLSFVNPMLRRLDRDNEPTLLLFDSEQEVTGGVYYPVRRFCGEIMDRFAHDFLLFLEWALRNPHKAIRDFALR